MPLSNEQYDAIERDYDRKRARAARELAARLERIHAEVPALAAVEEEMTDLAFQGAVAAASGNTAAAGDIRKRRDALSERKRQILADAGLTASDLEMHYECPACGDTGYINSRPCECRKRAVVDLLYDQSGLKDILMRENFDTFRADIFSPVKDASGKSVRDIMLENKAFLMKYTEAFGQSRGNILLRGTTGTGKTFMTHCIAKALLDKGFSVIYLTAGELFDIMAKETFSSGNPEEDGPSLLDTCDLLIIDDLGTELTNRFTVTGLFNCLNGRMINGRSMVISTNLSLEELKDLYTERVTSRIMGNFRIRTFPGEDVRLTARLMAQEENK